MKSNFLKIIILIFIFNFSSFSEEIKYNVIKEISTMDEIHRDFLKPQIIDITDEKTETEDTLEDKKDSNQIFSSNSITETEEEKTNIENSDTQKEFSLNSSSSEQNKEKNLKSKDEIMNREERHQEITDRSNRVTALGSAMGAVDLGSTPAKKVRLGAGVGNSSSSQAVAVGIGYAPTENFRVNTKFSSSTDNINRNSISVGASYDLDI